VQQLPIIAAVLLLAAAAAAIVLVCLWRISRRRARKSGDPASDYAVRQDWSKSGGKVNYSSFIYFDVDRDGVYGVADRPMTGIAVRLVAPNGRVTKAASNLCGFANFVMSTKSRRASIRAPGCYRFEVSVPPGWISTSGNETQTKQVKTVKGSPTGLGTGDMLQPVGLAPRLYAAGRTAPGMPAEIIALRSEQALSSQLLPADAAFDFALPEGADSVHVLGAGIERRLRVGPYPLQLGLLSAGRAALAADAPLETVSFDGVTPEDLKKVPNGYAGLDWFNLNALGRGLSQGSHGAVNGACAGHLICYTSSGHPGEIRSRRPFGFHSIKLTAAWLQSEGELALVESWNGHELIASDSFPVSALTPVHYLPMLPVVTRIRLSTRHCWQLVLDELTISRR
jgi:hypothetical protein